MGGARLLFFLLDHHLIDPTKRELACYLLRAFGVASSNRVSQWNMAISFASLGGKEILGEGQRQGHSWMNVSKDVDEHLVSAEPINRLMELQMSISQRDEIVCFLRRLHSCQ